MYEGALVDCFIDQMQYMENILRKYQKEDFRFIVHKMELDRIRYFLSSYLRIRLEKIEKFGAHMLHEESEDLAVTNMSAEERVFAYRYVTNLKDYLRNTAIKKMPPNMQFLKFEEIVCKPQMDQSVFVKVKKECLGVILEEFDDYDGDEEIVDLVVGSQHVLRYRPITTLIKNGSLQLM
ncbi:DNA replication complex GINS protein SLD5 isoform X2 [Parasteatoda tepidariorum]|nr:DNA replication complex GINS protein SLD5 isoform X2 [Parasteatoda tepidariorum]XP_042901954.1 DNA replication complex GINS protein SLD5 isoform X2 [Parasteatoda tepidariorum]